MALDKATVARIAALARIKVDDAEAERIAGELRAIVGWVEQLNRVDTANVEPMTSAVAVTLPMREDRVDDGGRAGDILANAREPAAGGAGGFFTVPKVVE